MESRRDRVEEKKHQATARARKGLAMSGDHGNESEPNRELIAARAYDRYLARGGESGHDLDDWLEAEREVREQRDRYRSQSRPIRRRRT